MRLTRDQIAEADSPDDLKPVDLTKWRRVQYTVPRDMRAARVGEGFLAHRTWDYQYPLGDDDEKVPLWVEHRLYTQQPPTGDDRWSDVPIAGPLEEQVREHLWCYECEMQGLPVIPVGDFVVTGRTLPTNMREYLGSRPDPFVNVPYLDEDGRTYTMVTRGDVRRALSETPYRIPMETKRTGVKIIPHEFDKFFERRNEMVNETRHPGIRAHDGERRRIMSGLLYELVKVAHECYVAYRRRSDLPPGAPMDWTYKRPWACAYCGTKNPAAQDTCNHCGGSRDKVAM